EGRRADMGVGGQLQPCPGAGAGAGSSMAVILAGGGDHMMLPSNETTPSGHLSPADADPAREPCEHCGVPLLREHCYACGQPVKGLVRHFSSLVGDFLDSVFDWDGRLPLTLWPLFARPGYLTAEYLAGRRVRYVSPVRLFFFLAIVTFSSPSSRSASAPTV